MLNVWIALISFFQIAVAITTVIYIIVDLRPKASSDCNRLTVSKWVFYFGAFAAFFLSLGIRATLKDPAPKSADQWMVCALFAAACIFGVMCMVLQKNWKITYSNDMLIVRNWLWISKEYPCAGLIVRIGRHTKQIWLENNKIAEWDPRMVNMYEELNLIKFLRCRT